MQAFESESWTSVPAVASVGTAVFLGVTLSLRFMFPYLSVVECAAAGPPIGLTLSVWITLVLKSFVFQSTLGQPPAMALLGSVIQLAIALYFAKAVQKSWDRRAKLFAVASVKALKLPLAALVVASVWLGYLHYTHSLGRWGDSYFVGGTVYGDMPFHLGVISSLLWGANGYVITCS
jgi:hypothetical protein